MPIGNQGAQEGERLSFTISATDPNQDSLTLNAANLPAGASFDAASGQFSWTPSSAQAGDYPVTFTVSDGLLTDSETITITVQEAILILGGWMTTASGGPVSGVSVSLWDLVSRRLLGTTVTTTAGSYRFEAPLVQAGRTYGVAPRPTRDWRFHPVGRRVLVDDHDQTDVNFTAVARMSP